MTGPRYTAHEPTPTNTDPHVIDTRTGEIAHDTLTLAEARALAARLSSDPLPVGVFDGPQPCPVCGHDMSTTPTHNVRPCDTCNDAAQVGHYAPCQDPTPDLTATQYATRDDLPAGAIIDPDLAAFVEELAQEYAAAVELVRDRAQEARAGAHDLLHSPAFLAYPHILTRKPAPGNAAAEQDRRAADYRRTMRALRDAAMRGVWRRHWPILVPVVAAYTYGYDEAGGNIGRTYDNDPDSPRSQAYDLGRTAGESASQQTGA